MTKFDNVCACKGCTQKLQIKFLEKYCSKQHILERIIIQTVSILYTQSVYASEALSQLADVVKDLIINYQLSFAVIGVIFLFSIAGIWYYTQNRLPDIQRYLTNEFHSYIHNYEVKYLAKQKELEEKSQTDLRSKGLELKTDETQT